MERLTTEYIGYHVPIATCSMNRFGEADDCSDCKETCEQYAGACSTCPIQKAFSKLAEYEDLGYTPEELRLSFNPPNVLYIIDCDKEILPVYPVDREQLSFSKGNVWWNCRDSEFGDYHDISLAGLHKDYFLTNEEAFAALQAMQEGAE